MSYLDTLYRAFLEFRKLTADNNECAAQRKAIAEIDADKDSVEVTRVLCTIEEDWIDAIEEGLVHVERAIKQERQFIRANGEIVPIEKVKRVSRDSVEHLSRHSNLITKIPKDEDLVPERLYTVERLNDYAVYENRFLYMLLTYLDEFIGMRYTKILDLTNTYQGSVVLDKSVSTRREKIKFKLKLDEKRHDDPIMRELNPNKSIIERIGMLLKTVDHFLATPLMEEVGKAAKLKPPITKTNVLKMDKDFKGAVALYEFVAAYDKDGYTVETVKKKMKFSEVIADEFAETYALASFLAYEYGMGIKDMLKDSYEAEEARRKAIEQEQHLEQLRRLRRRIAENGESPEEYMLLLEKELRIFEGFHTKLDDALVELDKVKEENEKLHGEVTSLTENVAALNTEIAQIEQKHLDDITSLNARHDVELAELNAACRREIADLNDSWRARWDSVSETHRSEMETLNSEHERVMKEIVDAHDAELIELDAQYRKTIDDQAAVVDKLTAENGVMRQECDAEMKRLTAKYAAVIKTVNEDVQKSKKALADVKEENRLLADLKALSDGRLNALRHKYGLMTDAEDFTSEAAFNEIERQYDAFRNFFKGEWKKTKKKIRDELLHPQKSSGSGNGKKSASAKPAAEHTSAASKKASVNSDAPAKSQADEKAGGDA